MKRLFKKGDLWLNIGSKDEGSLLKPINKYMSECFEYLEICIDISRDKLTIFFGDQEISEISLSKLICEDIKYHIDDASSFDEDYVSDKELKKLNKIHGALGEFISNVTPEQG